MLEYSTLIEFYFHKKVKTIDEYCEYLEKLRYLSDVKVLNIQITTQNKK
jgi:hypothetical protein